MIYSCTEVKTTGPNGTILKPRAAEDAELVCVGEAGGRQYYVGMVGGPQPSEIDLREETMTPEIDSLIKRSQLAAAKKQAVRKDIEENVGDIYDLIADQAKTIEFLFVLVSRMADEYLGGNALSADKKADYLARVQAVTGALDANQITLRGDFTDPNAMLSEVMGRTNYINSAVKTSYAEKIDALVNL